MGTSVAVATGTPLGCGHVYAPEHYVDAWVAVADIPNWSAEALTRLKTHLGSAARASLGAGGDNPYVHRGGQWLVI
ncbi:putative membrane protein [Bradyrhizobium sp. USDA 328]|jgi:uncharacterized membrane protein